MAASLRLGQRARLALERDFFGARPTASSRVQRVRRAARAGASREMTACRRRSRRNRAGGRRWPACGAYSSHSRAEQIEVALDLACVLVGVDAEVAEMAALPAERNVQVQRRAALPGRAVTRAPASRRARPPRASRPKTADNWRRSSCRPPSARRRRARDLWHVWYYTCRLLPFAYLGRHRMQPDPGSPRNRPRLAPLTPRSCAKGRCRATMNIYGTHTSRGAEVRAVLDAIRVIVQNLRESSRWAEKSRRHERRRSCSCCRSSMKRRRNR